MNVKKINSYQSIADAVGALVETAARRWVRVELGHWSEDKQTDHVIKQNANLETIKQTLI